MFVSWNLFVSVIILGKIQSLRYGSSTEEKAIPDSKKETVKSPCMPFFSLHIYRKFALSFTHNK